MSSKACISVNSFSLSTKRETLNVLLETPKIQFIDMGKKNGSQLVPWGTPDHTFLVIVCFLFNAVQLIPFCKIVHSLFNMLFTVSKVFLIKTIRWTILEIYFYKVEIQTVMAK